MHSAVIAARKFVTEYDRDVYITHTNSHISVKTKENEHFFMDNYHARTWIKGREYYIDKPNTEKEFSYLYRSGYKVTE